MAHTRVLVIDDDKTIREAMCEQLRAGGCEVFDTGSPIGVSKLVAQHQINVVVVDVIMPDISGDKLVKLLRSNPRLNDLAVVLVSSSDPQQLRTIAKEVDADAVVTKSELRAQLTLVVQNAHRKRSLMRTTGR